MGVVQKVEDGKFVESNSAASLANAKKKAASSSSLDKDAFLQLLVAQMKYQDPLEPTSNTESFCAECREIHGRILCQPLRKKFFYFIIMA